MNLKIETRWLAAALSVCSASTAFAATEQTTFDVTATVSAACSVSAANLNFGAYDPASLVDNTSTTTITSNCTLLTTYSIGLDGGAEANVSARKMTGDGANLHKLNYTLETPLAANWGNGPTDDVDLTGTGLDVPTVVTGTIPAGQNVEAGNYTDTITVTLTY